MLMFTVELLLGYLFSPNFVDIMEFESPLKMGHLRYVPLRRRVFSSDESDMEHFRPEEAIILSDCSPHRTSNTTSSNPQPKVADQQAKSSTLPKGPESAIAKQGDAPSQPGTPQTTVRQSEMLSQTVEAEDDQLSAVIANRRS